MNPEIKQEIINLFTYFKSNKLTVPSTDIGSWEFELFIKDNQVNIITIIVEYIDGYTFSTQRNKLYFHYNGNEWWEGNEEDYYNKYYN